MKTLILILVLISAPAFGQDFLSEPEVDSESIGMEVDRDPAATSPNLGKRNYPGAADEEELRVLPKLPEASIKSDARSVQREVFKALYNQELKDERHDSVEE